MNQQQSFNPEIFSKLERFRMLPTRAVSKHCFACGADNHEGLKMTFYTDDRYVISKVFIPESKRGWDTIVHGGIVSTIMDEIMAWGAICASKKIIFTKEMFISYRQPVFINSEIRTAAWVENMTDKQAAMKSVLYDSNNALCSEADARYALLSGKLTSKMNLLSKEAIEGFEEFIKQL